MSTDGEQTPIVVVFRQWHDGSVIALFPTEDADGRGVYCVSYEHLGQHGSADYAGVVMRTRPAQVQAYQSLKQELERIGYVLQVRSRYQRRTACIS